MSGYERPGHRASGGDDRRTHAQRRRQEAQEAVRKKLAAHVYIHKMIGIADEAITAEADRIPALRLRADIYTRLLAKCLPDLKAIEVSGDGGERRVIVVPVASQTAEEWAAQVRQEREHGLLPGVTIEHEPSDAQSDEASE